MRVCTLNFQKNANGILDIVNSKTLKVTDEVMMSRMSAPLARLTYKRIAVRVSKNYDKTILSKEIGMLD